MKCLMHMALGGDKVTAITLSIFNRRADLLRGGGCDENIHNWMPPS